MTAEESPRRLRVMIVDDHAVVRRGLRAFIEAVDGLEVVAEAGDGVSALETIARMSVLETPPDVVLLDLMMPRLDGQQTIAEIGRLHPSVRVVVMSSFGDATRVQALLAAGAVGYVVKDSDAMQVIAAIRAAHAGQVHLDPVVARGLVDALSHRDTIALTDRERDVLGLVATGLSNQEIASELMMSERTARTHVSSILMKLGVQSRTQAALWALKEGLVELD